MSGRQKAERAFNPYLLEQSETKMLSHKFLQEHNFFVFTSSLSLISADAARRLKVVILALTGDGGTVSEKNIGVLYRVFNNVGSGGWI